MQSHRPFRTAGRPAATPQVNRTTVPRPPVQTVVASRQPVIPRTVAVRSSIASQDANLLKRNYMASAEAVNLTGPPLDEGPLQWPEQIKAAFGISMRMQRWNGMKARLGPWAGNVQLWPATNGQMLDLRKWKATGKVPSNVNLTRGEIGCHDSHVRIWEHIVKHNIPVTMILEDDANIRHTKQHETQFRELFEEITRLQLNDKWDLIYLGRGREVSRRVFSSKLVEPKHCCGLFAYVLSLQGAKKLLAKARPYRKAVDVLVAEMHDSNQILALAMVPKMCYVVSVRSDTANIR